MLFRSELAVEGARLTDAGLVVDTVASGKVSLEATDLGSSEETTGTRGRMGR